MPSVRKADVKLLDVGFPLRSLDTAESVRSLTMIILFQ